MLNDNRPRSDRSTIFANGLTAVNTIWLFTALSVCVTVAAFAIAVVFVVLPAERRDQVTGTWVEHTHQTIDEINGILTSASDAESAQRDFLLTGDAGFLAPYDDGVKTIRQHLATAEMLTVDNPGQQGRLRVLHGLIDARLAVLARTIDLASSGDLKTAGDAMHEGGGKALMDTMRGTIRDMIAEENRLLHARRLDYATAQEWNHLIILALMIFATCGILITGTLAMTTLLAKQARKQSAQHLAQVENAAKTTTLLAAIVTSSDSAILSETLDGTVTSCNPGAARMFGFDALDIIGENIRIVIPPERLGEEEQFLDEIKNGNLIDHYETERLTKDGLRVAVSISMSPLYDQARQIVGAAKIIRNISTRKIHDAELETARQTLAVKHSALEKSNVELEEFGYAVSHDLKAPLRAIENLAEWIDEDIKGTASSETRENLALLRKRVERMQMLIAGLLDYCRNEQSTETVEDVDVGAMVKDIVTMQGPPPRFVVGYEGQRLECRTSPVALQVVLENLISNGIKHHDSTEGRVSITARSLDEFVEFRVSDDGPGIPEKFHERIFKIFQTLQSRDDLESSGIGLAMVKRKVEAHGGRIWVESAPPVRGTAFVFTWQKFCDDGSSQPRTD